jgi:hypothetical protein
MFGEVRSRVAIGVVAGTLAAATAGCPSLDALECHGGACGDAAAGTDGASGDSGPSSGGIYCGAGGPCTPPTNECCFEYTTSSTSCKATFSCNGSDIFCDDPSQCAGGSTCWICITTQGFQGTSCDYQNDIVKNDHCDQSTAKALCHDSSQCEGGTTCQPLPVLGFDAGAGGDSWFHACQ